LRFLSRTIAWIATALALPVAFGLGLGRLGAVIGVAIVIAATMWIWLWLPRMAHAAFDAGQFKRARRRYRTLQAFSRSVGRERSALLSRVGCHVACSELEAADKLLATLDPATFDTAERAVWLNNRACALVAKDPQAALALVDEATALRPDVPALQHTRGMALLAVGRVEDAIAVLDGMRAAGELPPRLEADRCRELARAWAQKGEVAYSDDYRMRAEALGR
jgi:predicted Zn-dependent protease